MQKEAAYALFAGTAPKVTLLIVAAECPEIPGCFSERETQQEAEVNLRKAIDACLSVIFEDLLSRIRPEVPAPIESGPYPGRKRCLSPSLASPIRLLDGSLTTTGGRRSATSANFPKPWLDYQTRRPTHRSNSPRYFGVTLAIPNHRTVKRATLHKLVRAAGLTDARYREKFDTL